MCADARPELVTIVHEASQPIPVIRTNVFSERDTFAYFFADLGLKPGAEPNSNGLAYGKSNGPADHGDVRSHIDAVLV